MDVSDTPRRLLPLLGFCVAASCSDVRVMAVEVSAIELDPPSASILLGDSVRLQARLLDGSGHDLSGHDVAWSSSDPAAAPVDGTGLVRGVAPARATVTAESGGARATAEVVVNRPAPGLTGVEPSSAQRLQTLDLVLTGSEFAEGVTTVDLGEGITVDAIRVAGPASITATVTISGGAQLGARNVSVTNPPPGGGTATLAGGFTVLEEHPSPTVAEVDPARGQRQETLEVTITGSGFLDGATAISFGSGVQVNGLAVQSSTVLTASITIDPAADLGSRDVSVVNAPPGGGTATLSGGFTILAENPSPTIGSTDPDAGQRKETLDVELTGSGFLQDLTAVSFGPDITVNTVAVSDSTSLIATITIGPGATLGARDVTVSNPAPGGGTDTLTSGFTVLEENPAPTVTMALPGSGVAGVTMDVTLLGSGFVQGLTRVSFGEGITVNSVNVVFWTSLTANITIAADAAPGPRDVSVTNPPPGGGTFIMHDGFAVLPSGGI